MVIVGSDNYIFMFQRRSLENPDNVSALHCDFPAKLLELFYVCQRPFSRFYFFKTEWLKITFSDWLHRCSSKFFFDKIAGEHAAVCSAAPAGKFRARKICHDICYFSRSYGKISHAYVAKLPKIVWGRSSSVRARRDTPQKQESNCCNAYFPHRTPLSLSMYLPKEYHAGT